MKSTINSPRTESVQVTPVLRLLVLGAVYAMSVFLAVAFSPTMGLHIPQDTASGALITTASR